MEGQTVSHYEVLERLGGGGMGVVYRALDTKLNRHVALKFLPRDLTREDEARERFVLEAQAASGLDHPNICTIYEIDSTPDGQMFIAMAVYDGATLKQRINQGPMPVAEALGVAVQVAQGLAKAHAAGIVHRDIKPANLMLTHDGLVKILDFGIAKLLGVAGPTVEGSTLGTVSYMAPEQVAGLDAEPKTDVWALGVVLYEMLTSRPPFRGQSPWAVMNAITNHEPERPSSLRAEIPKDVEAAVLGALEKDPGRRTKSAEAFRAELDPHQQGSTEGGRTTGLARTLSKPVVAIPALAAIVALVAWGVVSANHAAKESWAREEALPQVLALIERDDYSAAYALAEEVERAIPNDPVLADAWEATAVTGGIATDPPGAGVYLRSYGGNDAQWRLLGQSPIEGLRLPRSSPIELLIEREGFESRVLASGVPGFYFGRNPVEVIALVEDGGVPPGMVLVPGGMYPVRIADFTGRGGVQFEPFFIDRYEVTNTEYKEFVDAGAYERPEFWEGLDFVLDGRRLSWEEAMAEMVDGSGRPGPATWELSDFPDGLESHPVGGVSWYEAVAYNRFRGTSLPTLYHWAHAAFESNSIRTALTNEMVPRSNFGGEGAIEVGTSGAMGPHGTFDTAGNLKEWTWNASGENHWLLGGDWEDETYMANTRFTSPPFDRASGHGFRRALYPGGSVSSEFVEPVPFLPRDFRSARPVSDDVYAVYERQTAYVPAPLNPATESVDSDPPDWRREHVTIDAGYDDERLSLYLFLPKSVDPPYQVLIYFGGANLFSTPSNAPSSELVRLGPRSTRAGIVRSGRAIVAPVWNGSFERWDDWLALADEDEYQRAYRERLADWRADLGQTIDFIAAREDLEEDKIVFLGGSFGASNPLGLLALEDRLQAALLVNGGYTFRRLPPEVDAVNYAPRITLPVLMTNGEYDYVFPLDASQRALYEQLGTPDGDKKHILYQMGHGPTPVGQFLGDVLPWLDRYLGAVR